jgi:stage V sporulation protein G
MPSRKLTAHCPSCRCKNQLRAAFCNQCGARLQEVYTIRDDEGRAKLYADIAHPINSACRELIQQRVIVAFEEERARAQLPGYVPSYDDYEEDMVAEVHLDRPGMAPTQLQQAELPRGPHRSPGARSSDRPRSRPGKEFGAGIFD